MGLPPNARSHFARQHMDDAAKTVRLADQARRDNSEKAHVVYEKFHTNLALISGGTIALSLTLLGYLKNSAMPIVHRRLLYGSWICLMLCVVTALFAVLFDEYYGFHFVGRRVLQSP
jgi:hypothetical protein